MVKKTKGKTRAKAAKIGAGIEAQGKDAAHKIWLAGIGAYGRAYSEARDGALKLNAGTSEFFDDLVKRGAEIEGDVMSRLASNERVSTAASRVMKARTNAEAQIARVAGVATRLQEQQRELLEARMEQMRSALGLGKKDDKAAKLHAKLDRLEDEVAALRGKTKSSKARAGKATRPDTDITARIARLTSEIETIAAANTPASPKAKRKTAAKKKAPVRKATTARKKTVTKKPAARKTAARKPRARKS